MVHSETTARFKPLGWGVAVGRECIPFHGQYGSYTLEFLSSTQLKKECLGERPHLQCREMWRLQRPFVQASQCTGAADCSHLYYMCSRVTAFILVGQVEQESGLFPSGHIRRLHYHVPPTPLSETMQPPESPLRLLQYLTKAVRTGKEVDKNPVQKLVSGLEQKSICEW